MSATHKTPFYRKFALVYPRFQLLLMVCNLSVLTVAFAAVVMNVAASYAVLRQQGISAGMPPDHSYFNFLDLQARLIYKSIALALGLSFLGMGLVTLWLSNRLAGPIVRLREYFRNIAVSGNYDALRFRKDDFFPDLPEAVNDALTTLKPHSQDKR
jgi:hypothetical protein